MKLDFNRIAFALAVIVVSILVAIGKLPVSTLGVLLAWLARSPMHPVGGPTDGHEADNSP